jgi:hypothetical protein
MEVQKARIGQISTYQASGCRKARYKHELDGSPRHKATARAEVEDHITTGKARWKPNG